MEILYLLIPLAGVLVVIISLAFVWAVNNDQFDDLQGPADRILRDDDRAPGNPDKDTSVIRESS